MYRTFSLLFCLLLFACSPPSDEKLEADIVIYGGTAASITAAVQAIKWVNPLSWYRLIPT